ncbi:flagellar biosynthetic protein FliO [Parasphingorhabdus cellanae]|uniref:Flagellar protein n=1 Tax=Parasphingorhabdus cellanae TaxID=2806553 RepID=A0ABX7T7D9_9SPHN|nr:flagellar biosynthetic protein FliO [Parasphingorhabdus cellanae]QTD56130.1 flagellar biosynthetic protein FliO [Parasphingorhabdus cellanae]
MGIGTVVSSIMAIVVAMIVVLAMAWGVIWLLRKLQDRTMTEAGEGGGERPMRFIRALPLGQRERLVLVEIGGEQLLLGVGGGIITMLAEWDAQGRRIHGADLTEQNRKIDPAILAGIREARS